MRSLLLIVVISIQLNEVSKALNETRPELDVVAKASQEQIIVITQSERAPFTSSISRLVGHSISGQSAWVLLFFFCKCGSWNNKKESRAKLAPSQSQVNEESRSSELERDHHSFSVCSRLEESESERERERENEHKGRATQTQQPSWREEQKSPRHEASLVFVCLFISAFVCSSCVQTPHTEWNRAAISGSTRDSV